MAGGGIGKSRPCLREGQSGAAEDQRVFVVIQKVQQLRVLLGERNVCPLREAGGRLLDKTGRADNKKPLNTICHALFCGPFQNRTAQYGFQHQRLPVNGYGGILLHQKYGAAQIHGTASLLSVMFAHEP